MPDLVDDAEPRVLVAALVHQTGDFDLLERAERAVSARSVPTEAAAVLDPALRSELADLLRLTAAGPADGPPGKPRQPWQPGPPAPVDDHQLARLATWCAGETVTPEYWPLIREEIDIDRNDARRFEWTAGERPARADHIRIAVIGAGLGGVLAGVRLGQAGLDYVIFEKNTAIGGTWYENDYPDLRVDVPSHFYSYSFAPNPEWSDHYARRHEIHAYVERCADTYGVRPHVRLITEVVSALFDEGSGRWTVTTSQPDGRREEQRFDAVISAVGMLNRPQLPDLAGLDTFAGPSFHSSRWDHSIDLTGRRVGVIGTGASAVQLVPAVAPVAGHLTVFQRARHWVAPNPLYLAPLNDADRWLHANLPTYATWTRFLRFWQNGDRIYPAFRVDPDWPDPDRSISAANDKFRRRLTAYLGDQLGGDQALIDRVLPDYPPLGKRILQDNRWFQTLRRDNVTLVDDPIDRVEPGVVLTRSGERVELDVLVLATGFHANRYLWPMEITGRHGGRLDELWGDDPRAHLGITVPGFPNLFCIYGPNTNPVVGSVVMVLECQVGYVMASLRALIEGGWASMECRQDAHDEYNRRIDAEHEAMVWRHPRVHSYYNNAAGRVTTNAPWKLIDYWRMTSAPDLDEFHLVAVDDPAPAISD